MEDEGGGRWKPTVSTKVPTTCVHNHGIIHQVHANCKLRLRFKAGLHLLQLLQVVERLRVTAIGKHGC